MLDRLTLETFTPLVGQSFTVAAGGQQLFTVTLEQAAPLAGDADSRRRRAPFALEFVGPSNAIAPQGIYDMHHDDLGELGLFLVPIRRDAKGSVYEAVFT